MVNKLLKYIGIPFVCLSLGTNLAGCLCDEDSSSSSSPATPGATNNAPTINTASVEIIENYPYDFTPLATDPDGDPLTTTVELCDSLGENCSPIPTNFPNPIDNDNEDNDYQLK